MARDGTVTFSCMVGDFHAAAAKAAWALLSQYCRSSCCSANSVAHFVLRETIVTGPQYSLLVCPHKIRQIKVPIVVIGQSQLVTQHEYPIIHSPSKAFKAVDVSKVHPWVCVSQHVALLFLSSVLLCASA